MTRRLLVSLLLIPLAACTHAMHVKNLGEYAKAPPSIGQGVRIALEDGATTAEEREYFKFVHEALAVTPGVQVALRANQPNGFTPDAVVKVRPRGQYHGSGWNYLITFP